MIVMMMMMVMVVVVVMMMMMKNLITDSIKLEKLMFKINQDSNIAVIINNYYLGHQMIFFSEIQVKYRPV